MNTVDAQIRFTIMAILRSFSGLITTIVAISYTSPIFLVLVPPLGVAYYFLQVGLIPHHISFYSLIMQQIIIFTIN